MASLSLAEAIQAFLKNSRTIKSGVQALQIEEIWEQLMGKTIARYTDKIEIVQGKLFITSSTASLKDALRYEKEKIIKNVNEALGEVVIKDVIIK